MTDPSEGFFTIEEAAVRHGAFRWVERRLYELTGSKAAMPGLSAPTRVHLFEAATLHADHAQRWAARLPVLAGSDADALTQPAGSLAGPLVEAAFGSRDESELLDALYGVIVPRLLVSYRRHSGSLSEAAGKPALRALRVVVTGTQAELDAGAALLEAAVAVEVPGGGPLMVSDVRSTLDGLAADVGDGLFPW